jgi:hypothetical protein
MVGYNIAQINPNIVSNKIGPRKHRPNIGEPESLEDCSWAETEELIKEVRITIENTKIPYLV